MISVVDDPVDNQTKQTSRLLNVPASVQLEDMPLIAIDGVVRGMVVTGHPGVGKSFGVELVLEKNNLFDKIAGNMV